jgi:hypothetical protein
MAQRFQLSEETRRLAGLRPRACGGLPVALTSQPRLVRETPEKASTEPASAAEDLHERRLTLFRDIGGMSQALERAHGLVSRVSATLQSGHVNLKGGGMHERARASMYQLHQEMQASLESIAGMKAALEELESLQKEAAREARQRRRQGR